MQEFVVNESSGSLDRSANIENYPLQRNHFTINKFNDNRSEDWLIVTDVLSRILAHAKILSANQRALSMKRLGSNQ